MLRIFFSIVFLFFLTFKPAVAQDRGLEVAVRSLAGADIETGRQYALFIAVDTGNGLLSGMRLETLKP
ncbi:MAG: hypothetical protein A3J97_00010 [Spirochaetes bacterium RIFOXYC1_FULL_54_7]|nr:MAG: hypothetical protein A3J97_00010 [Spirochaetes bacterium RIFOXYC1_FULL_54_7]